MDPNTPTRQIVTHNSILHPPHGLNECQTNEKIEPIYIYPVDAIINVRFRNFKLILGIKNLLPFYQQENVYLFLIKVIRGHLINSFSIIKIHG